MAHTHVVESTVLQQLRVSAKQKRQRQFPFAACVVNSPLQLTLNIRSAGSVSLGCIVEELTVQGLSAKGRGIVKHNHSPGLAACALLPSCIFLHLWALSIVNKCSCALSKAYRDNCTISSNGWGFNLDSLLLIDLALSGSDIDFYFSDASFVDGVFVNIVSNRFVAMAQEVFFNLQWENGGAISKV